jgi:hypothetical protein
MSWIIEIIASRFESGAAQGLMLSMPYVCSAPISGMRCFRLGHRDESVRTTIAPREPCRPVSILKGKNYRLC